MGQWKTPTTPSKNKHRIFCPPTISLTKDQASAGRRFLNKQMRPCFNQSFKGTNFQPSKGRTFQMLVGYFQTRSLLLHRMILIQCHAILLHYWTQQMTLARSWTPKNWMSISTKALLDNRSAFQRQIAHLGFSSSRFALSALGGSKKSGWADELIETVPQNLKFKQNKNPESRWQFTWQNKRNHLFSSNYLVFGSSDNFEF